MANTFSCWRRPRASHIFNRSTSCRAKYATVRMDDITEIENNSYPSGLAALARRECLSFCHASCFHRTPSLAPKLDSRRSNPKLFSEQAAEPTCVLQCCACAWRMAANKHTTHLRFHSREGGECPYLLREENEGKHVTKSNSEQG